MGILTAEEDEFIRARLTATVSGLGCVRATLAIALPPRLQCKLADGVILPADLVTYALRICDEDGYATEPPAFYDFLRNVLPNEPRVQTILDRIRIRPPPQAVHDPFDATLLDNKLPFLGRPAVRAHLRALLQSLPTQPIVVINGGPKTGKTFTTELIGHVRRYREVLPCHVELQEKGEGAAVGPRELASDIITQLGADPDDIPQQSTNAIAWARDLANWIVWTAERSGEKCWIALDGFNKSELRDDTRVLIVKLATAMTKGRALEKHRLILIDFDHTHLLVQPGMIAQETANGLERRFVSAFVNQLIQQANKELAGAGGALDAKQIDDRITQGLGEPIQDLPELAKRLQTLMATLKVTQ